MYAANIEQIFHFYVYIKSFSAIQKQQHSEFSYAKPNKNGQTKMKKHATFVAITTAVGSHFVSR